MNMTFCQNLIVLPTCLKLCFSRVNVTGHVKIMYSLALRLTVLYFGKSLSAILFGGCRGLLRTFARNFSNIDFFLKILPLKMMS